MSKVLKGNFKVKNDLIDEEQKRKTNDLEDQFEKEALKHLGGSIAFVSRRKVIWEEKEEDSDKKRKK